MPCRGRVTDRRTVDSKLCIADVLRTFVLRREVRVVGETTAEGLAALQERDREIAEIRFSETEVTITPEKVFGSFRATGKTRDGKEIDRRGLDIYEIRDGKIALKDSYWKQTG